MKNGFFLIIALFVLSYSFGANMVTKLPPYKAKDILIPIGNTGQKISLLDLSRIKIKEVETLTGKKMSLIEKAGFRAAQHKLRMNINYDGSISSKRLKKRLNKAEDGGSGFHLGGFALGLFLSLVGVLIAYLLPGDNQASRTKWAWIGAALSVIWIVILVA
jgi:hypothetical protein